MQINEIIKDWKWPNEGIDQINGLKNRDIKYST